MSARVSGRSRVLMVCGVLVGLLVALAACATQEQVSAPTAEPDYHDPAPWGERYPLEYSSWHATSEERPAGKSVYKRGFDGGVMYDKLSEYPFMPLLFKGWGFGIDYNEPRGHYYMLVDQSEVDPARVKTGGACLTCKSPYAEDLYEKDSKALFDATYDEAVAMLPKERRFLGATCIDCHDPATTQLATRRWTVGAAMSEVGLDPEKLTLQQQRLLVCGQCHCSYSVMKDGTTVLGVDLPWEGSTWGGITVENIVDSLETQEARIEWTQQVTGFKLGFIRHPDIEFFTSGSAHFVAGASCVDCHMPSRTVNHTEFRDHDVMSPLKSDMVACMRCHDQSAAELKAEVLRIQDRDAALLIDAGYRTATVAKLFEIANSRLATQSADIKPSYDEAAAHYRQAFYRVVYMGAENSMGFHNPDEGVRMLRDATEQAEQAEKILRDLLTRNGVAVPDEVPLELREYTDDRGVRRLDFRREQYIPDPTGEAVKKWPRSLADLLE
ncbi:MAG: ammonia-forming cytochrome c nitrite reductase subunit c552 [Actinomycetia bacterium]|nr:ammonia-forming cytochrome c nitrite reductase subunit c552 [Actinomycetes bacterium]